ncbi:hypothetical protein FOZ61_008242 [Perkinsus olseni]|uniref:Protein kinase domain-containing protein n=1 Tax=Perkinsus olseni TaxID=32597 RepID=A0A7J6L5L2_PEROL|nr:hypothetical protein FOZ61_008242 [Perkinsus olseni]
MKGREVGVNAMKYMKTRDATSVAEDLKVEATRERTVIARECVREILMCPVLSRRWIDLTNTLEQLARLAMLEAYAPRVKKEGEEKAKVLGRLDGGGTLWDQDMTEDAIRLMMEENRVNVSLRMLNDYKVWQYANWESLDDAVLNTAKENGGLDGHRVVDPHALVQSLLSKVNTFEESVGALLWKCLVHVEAMQLVDLPLLIRYCSMVLKQVDEKGIDEREARRQESLVIHYFHGIMKHSEELNTREVLELMQDSGLISSILHHLTHTECTLGLKAVAVEGLSLLADCEEFQCDLQTFLASSKDREALMELEKVAAVVVGDGLVKRSDVRPLLDLFTKCRRLGWGLTMGKVFSTLKKGGFFLCPQHITHVVAEITRELVDADSSIDFDSKYVIDDEKGTVGRGRFGMVVACCLKSEQGFTDRQLFALKIVEVDHGGKDTGSVQRIQEEIRVLRLVRGHPYVITLRDVDDRGLDSRPTVKLVFDLCEGGDLYERVRQVGNYSNREAKVVLRNLVDGLAFIHSKGLMHRDLKPENILMVNRKSNTEIKIADFGLARRSPDFPRQLPRSRTICGSDFYLAPEIIRQEEYGREIDIWAVGVIAYVVLTGSLPFYSPQLHKLYRQIVERDINLNVIGEDFRPLLTAGSKDFICRLLQRRPEDRLTAEGAVMHPWLRMDPRELSDDTYACPHAGS